ncbi:HTH-type transcriptional activator RhaS [Pontiella desulfatans]|uniref:HTH-type transcriptional activator RhaS n=1 Tax=Pontiella desulfatans TaxID=2750659 RepID=A0A6C2U313_PONDE|nr:helix-turn-helix domain-containing protein [Pontiella desulfatans]VGO14024.1 HTH-type transcriptional activator RhaS [Pontiella desulfatans]
MHQQRVPIYKEQGKTYHADSCEPLIKAVEQGALELSALGRASYPGEPIPDTLLPGLQSVGYWDAQQEQNWGLPWHRNEGIELTFLETGTLSFSVGETTLQLQPDALAITRPWQPHQLGAPNIDIGRLHWIIIDVGVRQPHQDWTWPDWLVITPHDLEELTTILRENEQPVWPATEEIRTCFREIGKTIRKKQSLSRIAIYTNELLIHLLELFRTQEVRLSKSLIDARRSVQLFLDSLGSTYAEPWTLDSMAESCGLGVTRFTHYCRKLTNQTPVQYLNRLRVDAAAGQLKNHPAKKIIDIAFDCGFSSSQYFATAFRKQHGMTPKSFRKQT